MNEEDILKIKVGQKLTLDGKYSGEVCANLESGEYSEMYKKEEWSYLKTGVLLDTDFAGLMHYPKAELLSEIQTKASNEDP